MQDNQLVVEFLQEVQVEVEVVFHPLPVEEALNQEDRLHQQQTQFKEMLVEILIITKLVEVEVVLAVQEVLLLDQQVVVLLAQVEMVEMVLQIILQVLLLIMLLVELDKGNLEAVVLDQMAVLR